MMRSLWLLPLLAAGITVSACSKAPEPAPLVIRPVLSMVVHPQVLGAAGFVGTVAPQVSTNLAFRTGGLLLSRNVNTGAQVKAGEILATVESTPLELAVRSAEAALSNAQTQLTNAAADETRQLTLVQSNNATQAVLETAQQKRRAAQAGVIQAQSQLSKADDQLGYARIAADFDGVVTAVAAEIGQVVAAGQTIITIAKPDARDVLIDIPEWLSASISNGTPFRIALQLDPSISVAGLVREIAPQADASTRTRRVRIGIVAPPPSFWLGTTVTATPADAGTAVIGVPATALLEADGKTSVWVIDEAAGTVSARPVTVSTALGDGLVPVSTGLEDGTRVVIAGVHGLTPGQQVSFDESAMP